MPTATAAVATAKTKIWETCRARLISQRPSRPVCRGRATRRGASYKLDPRQLASAPGCRVSGGAATVVGLRVAFALSRCSRTCRRLATGISVKAVAHLLGAESRAHQLRRLRRQASDLKEPEFHSKRFFVAVGGIPARQRMQVLSRGIQTDATSCDNRYGRRSRRQRRAPGAGGPLSGITSEIGVE